jgi:hypothetical protein
VKYLVRDFLLCKFIKNLPLPVLQAVSVLLP